MEKIKRQFISYAIRKYVFLVIIILLSVHAYGVELKRNIIVSQVDGEAYYVENSVTKPMTLNISLTTECSIILKNGSFTLLQGKLVCHQSATELKIRVGDLTFNERPGIFSEIVELWQKLTGQTPQKIKTAVDKGSDYLEKPMLLPAEGEVLNKGDVVRFVWRGDQRQFYDIKIETAESYYTPMLALRDSTTDTTLSVPIRMLFAKKQGVAKPTAGKFRWTVVKVGGEAKTFRNFSYTDEITQNNVADDIKEIANSPNANPELLVVLRATYYEDHKMYTAAYSAYAEGLISYPRSTFIRKELGNFASRVDAINERVGQ